MERWDHDRGGIGTAAATDPLMHYAIAPSLSLYNRGTNFIHCIHAMLSLSYSLRTDLTSLYMIQLEQPEPQPQQQTYAFRFK